MTKFVFFRGYVGTLNVMDGETYATASLNDDTPEGHMYQRPIEDEVITQEQYNLNRDMLAESERLRNQIRLFQSTTVTKVNPKFWTKVKIVLQETWRMEPVGVVVSILLTMVTIIGIAKILSIW